ncbi:MAG TPA: hypothetical protein PLU30_13785 [Verrucomicrobiae bacterium]|nr:hypothetical protein [Verrucomicrobiae bacterium]
MALRRAKPGAGSHLDTLREEGSDYAAGELVPDLGGVPYAVVGGLATARHMPQRMTLDTDILVAAVDRDAAEAAMARSGCEKKGMFAIGGSTWRMPGGRIVDLIALDAPWVADAIRTTTLGPDGLPYISLPYLVLMKLESGRLQDLADISRMLGAAEENVRAETRSLIGAMKPQDLEDLESMIELGRLEHADKKQRG